MADRKSLLGCVKWYVVHFFEVNYWLFALVLAVGLSTSEALMSIGMVGLFSNWFLEGVVRKDFNQKFQELRKNKIIISVLLLGYLSLIIGLLYTENQDAGFRFLQIEIPLLFLPLVYGSRNFGDRYIKFVFRSFIIGLLFSSLFSFLVYLGVFPIHKSLEDIRNISIFISHIRLSVFINFGIVLLVFFYKKSFLFSKQFSVALVIWFVFFLILLQAVTGWFILFVLLSVFTGELLIKNTKTYIKAGMVVLLLTGVLFSYFYVKSIYQKHFVPKRELVLSELDHQTKSGEVYHHRLEDNWVENGNRVWVYIAPKELGEAWNKRSKIDFDSIDKKGQPLWGTLYRYMASKGLRKDKEGLAQMTDEDIRNVEEGKTNCCIQLSPIEKRIKEIIFEYERFRNHQDPNGHSFTQRFLYLVAGKNIIKENFWLGVGTGDVDEAFLNYYDAVNSPLHGRNRKKAHNQYVTIMVALGLVGLLFWLVSFYFPLFIPKQYPELYMYFVLIVSLSFLTDNTLERHAGVIFYAFFNSIFIFTKKLKKETYEIR